MQIVGDYSMQILQRICFCWMSQSFDLVYWRTNDIYDLGKYYTTILMSSRVCHQSQELIKLMSSHWYPVNKKHWQISATQMTEFDTIECSLSKATKYIYKKFQPILSLSSSQLILNTNMKFHDSFNYWLRAKYSNSI